MWKRFELLRCKIQTQQTHDVSRVPLQWEHLRIRGMEALHPPFSHLLTGWKRLTLLNEAWPVKTSTETTDMLINNISRDTVNTAQLAF